jgi:hypothetical protein
MHDNLAAHARAFAAARNRVERLFPLLRALGIAEIRYDLNGSGDSGDCDLGEVLHADGTTSTTLPDLPIGFDGAGRVALLGIFLSNFAADLPEGDWVNNEGGYGTVSIRPGETDPDLWFECDMTYRTEYEDEDDEEFDDLHFATDDGDDVPAIVVAELRS